MTDQPTPALRSAEDALLTILAHLDDWQNGADAETCLDRVRKAALAAPAADVCVSCGRPLYQAEIERGEGMCFGSDCLGPLIDSETRENDPSREPGEER